MSQSAKCNTGRHLMSLKLYVSKLALFKLYFFKSKSYFKEMEIYFCELKMSFFELKICFLELKMYFCEFKLYLSKCVQICLLFFLIENFGCTKKKNESILKSRSLAKFDEPSFYYFYILKVCNKKSVYDFY